jgi:hypothetical protein
VNDAKEALNLLAVAALTVLVDHLLRPLTAAPGALLAEPVTIIAVSAALAAGTSTAFGVMNYLSSQSAVKAERDLRDQQDQQLRDEQAAASALSDKAAVAGKTFGKGATNQALLSGLGFGGTSSANGMGRSALTGGA